VGIESEPGWNDVLELLDAASNFEDSIAAIAEKMMMVCLAAKFVARNCARQVDGDQPAFVDQRAHVAIHGCDPKASHFVTGVREDFVSAEWAVRSLERPSDCTSLSGITFHRVG